MRQRGAPHRPRLRDRRGFVMPVVILALLVLSVISVAAIVTADDERRSSTAMRESAAAFYAAEAGLNEVWGNWPQALVDSLAPGDNLDLGWRDLDYGAGRYHAKIHRWDNGGQTIYGLRVEGRSAGPRAAQRVLSYHFTRGPGRGYRLGQCCDAAVTVRGDVHLVDGATLVDGHDEHPTAWLEEEGLCQDSLENKAGIIMQDTDLFSSEGGAIVSGEPPVDEDPTIDDNTFTEFGENLTWDSVKGLADHVIGDDFSEHQLKLNAGDVKPSYNEDGSCNTDDPFNWGSDDPSDACFGYFPIILVIGEVEVHNVYGQGVVILDWDDETGLGGEFELETNAGFNGLILGRGCVEIQDDADFHGAVFVDAKYYNEKTCGDDEDAAYEMHDDGVAHWSRCAVDRAIVNSGLAEFAEGEAGSIAPLVSRAFIELIR